MNESWDALDFLLRMLDAIWFTMKNNINGYMSMRKEIWDTSNDIQKEIDVACSTNESILAAYSPYETTVCDVIGSAVSKTPVNFDAVIASIEKLEPDQRPKMSDGSQLLDFLTAENGSVISPDAAVDAIHEIGVMNLAVDLQPIVRDFNAAVIAGNVADFGFAGRLAKQAEFLTGDHRNNISDAVLLAMIDSYNNGSPLRGDDILKFMNDHRSVEHEFSAAYDTLVATNGKVVTAQQVSAFIGVTGSHFSEDLLLRVKDGILAAESAEMNGEHKKISVLLPGEDKGKDAAKLEALEADTMSKLRAAFGTLSDGKGNVFYDPLTNATLDPTSAMSSADEKLTPDEKRAGYQHVSLAQYDQDERAQLGFACAWANTRDNITKSVDKINASHQKDVASVVEKAVAMGRRAGMSDRHANKIVTALMRGTLHYNVPGEPHPAEIRFGDLTALAQFKHQNEKLIDSVVESTIKQKLAAAQAAVNKEVNLKNSRVLGRISDAVEGDQSLDGMSPDKVRKVIHDAELRLLDGIRSADPKATEQIRKDAAKAEGERAAYVNRDDRLVKAFPELYAKAVELRDGNEHSGRILAKTMNDYALRYSQWLVASTNLYASQRGPAGVAEFRSMIKNGTALVMFADYARTHESPNLARHEGYQTRLSEAAALLSENDAISRLEPVRKINEKINSYCKMHGVNDEIAPQQYTEELQNSFVYEPGVDRPIPIDQVTTPEQICEIASTLMDAGQDEQAMKFVETLSHRSVVEAHQMEMRNAADVSMGNAAAGKPVCTSYDQTITKIITSGLATSAAALAVIGVYEAEALRPRGKTLSSMIADEMGDKMTPALADKLSQLSSRAAEAADNLKAKAAVRQENGPTLQRTRED